VLAEVRLPRLEGHQLPEFRLEGFETREAGLDLHFRRELNFHLMSTYRVCSFFVMISWVSFWLDVRAQGARVTLGTGTILTLSTLIVSFNKITPKTSYTKAIDGFTGPCLTFVMMTLLEFALVDLTLRKNEKSTTESVRRRRAKRIDLISRILFPSIFIGYTILYFEICLNH
jgi:hypothetical protein